MISIGNCGKCWCSFLVSCMLVLLVMRWLVISRLGVRLCLILFRVFFVDVVLLIW